MTRRDIPAAELLTALNDGPGEPHEDVRAAAEVFEVGERTVYRRIDEYRIHRVYRWVQEEEAA